MASTRVVDAARRSALLERPREAGEFGDGQLFGAEAGFGESVDEFSWVRGREVVAEGFALLVKTHSGEFQELWHVGDAEVGGGVAGREFDDGAFDFGRRAEGGGGDFEDALDVGLDLGGDAEVAVVAAAGSGADACRDFGLHQEDGLRDVLCREGAFEDRRGDVVRQVADDGARAPGAEIDLEDVALDDREAAFGDRRGEFLIQVGNQDGVKLDRDDALGAFEEALCERAAACANFDQQGSVLLTCCLSNVVEDRFAGQEMLAESAAQS